jgi:hypothetical protein
MTNLPYTQTASQPYVKLKSGARYNGSSAERSNGVFVKDKIVLGDTSFKTKDVAFYATGGATFANIGRKNFATQVAAGKINLYKYEYTTTSTSFANGASSTSTSKHILYYIQKKEDAPVMPLSYRFLQPMIEKRTPEFKMLEKYRQKRTVNRCIGYGSLGLLAAGIAMTGSNNTTVSTMGVAAAGISFVGGVVWGIGVGANKNRLLKTVLIADGMGKKKGHHELVKD